MSIHHDHNHAHADHSTRHHSHEHTHGHSHGLHSHHHGSNDGNRKGLIIALIITTSIMLLEFFGGLITNSLALLSDSGHMLSDAASLALSLFAFWLAAKPPSGKRTFGFHRFEILAAFFNGITLFIVAGVIIVEAIDRFITPTSVSSGSMIVIALIGLLANLMSAYFLIRKGDVESNLNMKSAYLHVIGDALGSIGAIIAGIIMLLFNWYYADPLISVIVAIIILKSAYQVVKYSIHILMEGTPSSIDYHEVQSSLLALDSVIQVHDLHIWTITSGIDSLSCHILIQDDGDQQLILQKVLHLLKNKFRIEHATIQIETSHINHTTLPI